MKGKGTEDLEKRETISDWVDDVLVDYEMVKDLIDDIRQSLGILRREKVSKDTMFEKETNVLRRKTRKIIKILGKLYDKDRAISLNIYQEATNLLVNFKDATDDYDKSLIDYEQLRESFFILIKARIIDDIRQDISNHMVTICSKYADFEYDMEIGRKFAKGLERQLFVLSTAKEQTVDTETIERGFDVISNLYESSRNKDKEEYRKNIKEIMDLWDNITGQMYERLR